MALSAAMRSTSSSLKSHQASRPSRRPVVRTQALFGWGKKKDDWKEQEKEAQFRAQQEMLEARRSGRALDDANQRRRKVAETVAGRKAARQAERDALARGEVPESLAGWRNYKNKEDETATSGLVVPLLPFGMPKYDGGERFDLRSPYADDGWVDPEETDALAGIKRFASKVLKFDKDAPTNQQGKPIVWASNYSQWRREQAQAKAAGDEQGKQGNKRK